MIQQREQGIPRILVGFLVHSKRTARNGFQIRVDDTVVGAVTSGSFSPSLGCSIALGYIAAEFKDHDNFLLGTQQLWLEAEKTDAPFV